MFSHPLPRLGLALVFTTLFTTLVACGKTPPASIEPVTAPNLPSLTLAPTTVTQETEFDGAVEALNQATVSAQTAGRVTELNFDVGDLVPKGATLLRLTDTEQQAAVTAAKGALAEAKVRFADAERNFKRAATVFEKKLISQADYDKAKTEFEAAKARVESTSAILKTTEQNLGYTQITAPYGGIVLERHVQVGESVNPGQPLLSGLSLEQLRVAVNVPASQIKALQAHQQAFVVLPNGSTVEATQLRFPPSAEAATQSFRVLVQMPEGDYGVYPGTLVKVRFASGQAQQLLVPKQALVQRGELTAVYVLSEANTLALRYVRLGTALSNNPNEVPVLAGLAAGDRVVMEPGQAAAMLARGR